MIWAGLFPCKKSGRALREPMQIYLPIAEVSVNAFLLLGLGGVVGILSTLDLVAMIAGQPSEAGGTVYRPSPVSPRHRAA